MSWYHHVTTPLQRAHCWRCVELTGATAEDCLDCCSCPEDVREAIEEQMAYDEWATSDAYRPPETT